jgi:hypothetical protein
MLCQCQTMMAALLNDLVERYNGATLLRLEASVATSVGFVNTY